MSSHLSKNVNYKIIVNKSYTFNMCVSIRFGIKQPTRIDMP